MSEEPTKAKDSPARERFASTTFRALPHAQTPEGVLEAKDAEIAALRAENEQLRKDLVSDFAGQRHELIQLRAECAKLRQAGERAVGKLREHLTGNVSEPLEETITKLRDAVAPSDAGKKWAAMARVCEGALKLGGITRIECQASNEDYAQWREDVAALRELEK